MVGGHGSWPPTITARYGRIMRQLCEVPSCDRPVNAKGACSMHYARMVRRGSYDLPYTDPEERQVRNFWAKVNKDGPVVRAGMSQCWVWTASLNPKSGYGTVWNGERVEHAHRVSLRMSGVDVSAGSFVCHHCDNRPCVRPDHLYVGDNSTNQQDAVRRGRWSNGNVKKTHCKRGHPFDERNTRINPRGQRVCRSCDSLLQARYKARKRLTR